MLFSDHEFRLYLDNDREIYRDYKLPLIKRLANARAARTYDEAAAYRDFVAVAEAAARKYRTDHHKEVSRGVITAVAKQLHDHFEDEYAIGALDSFITSASKRSTAPGPRATTIKPKRVKTTGSIEWSKIPSEAKVIDNGTSYAAVVGGKKLLVTWDSRTAKQAQDWLRRQSRTT